MWGRALSSFLVVLSFASSAQALTVAIDPGHGGAKEGASSSSGVKEKDISLGVARKLKTLLEAEKDVRVVMTRESDVHVDLKDRPALANREKADLFISIHCNSMPTVKARKNTLGVETYFLSADSSDAEAHALAARENADVEENTAADPTDPVNMILQDLSKMVAHSDAKRLAEAVHHSMVDGLKAKNRGVRQAPFVVLLGAEMPAILVEIGFISHPVEGKLLAEAAHQEKIALALRDAVHSFQQRVLSKRAAPADAKPAVVPPPQ